MEKNLANEKGIGVTQRRDFICGTLDTEYLA